MATAGLQKWRLVNGTWTKLYVLQDGLDIGVPYSVRNYPAAIDPATGGCRNITAPDNHGGTVSIYAITSTISANGDTGADPNKLVKVCDVLSATTLPIGNRPRGNSVGHFETLRSAKAGEVFRAVASAPQDRDGGDDDRQRGHNLQFGRANAINAASLVRANHRFARIIFPRDLQPRPIRKAFTHPTPRLSCWHLPLTRSLGFPLDCW